MFVTSIEYRELSKFFFTKYTNKILELSSELGKKNKFVAIYFGEIL